ncbi:hypothetical protein H0H81_008998 [Sphagnurus paluster]|uniref:Fe2OG dioxygenase domain-containing protein n=1 Tax=Sphagnurus paluster TaxID=117069 RepID=A0A9P7FW22_9AGAR|nr:hypothetical protein H0H81_008998 [Sphagnurus paluster]
MDDLQTLTEACEPTTFGLGQRDVLDEEYRKAGKMEKNKFSTNLDVTHLGILDRVRTQLLEGKEEKKYVKAELTHFVGTPCSDPSLSSSPLRTTAEWTFNSAALTQGKAAPSIAYIAFYSDVDHEVSLVTSGYRVTLTYNLFLDAKHGQSLPSTIKLWILESPTTWVDLSRATVDDLQTLSDACEPATFGLGQRDVLDEDYRKAGKMDKNNFSINLDLVQMGIVDRIRVQLLEGADEKKYVKAELYKLNVYGKGSFFKSHKDTPRGNTMFGSLVIVFPTPHDGGALKLSHDRAEWTFDSAALTRDEPTPSIVYIAFYSDVDHEVALVTSGHRVTLTYNLFLDPIPGKIVPSSVVPVAPDDSLLRDALKVALDDPSFLPDGCYLGFGLSFKYPISQVEEESSTDTQVLKGSDAMIFRVLKDLSLSPSLNAIYDISSYGEDIMVPSDHLFLSGDIDDEHIDNYLRRYHKGKIIQQFDKRRGNHNLSSNSIVWATPLTRHSLFGSFYTAYGNEPTTGRTYANLCIAVRVGPFGDRFDQRSDKEAMDLDEL